MTSACVTTTTGPYTANKSTDKAAEQYVALGITYLQEGNLELATARTKRALELRPDYAEGLAVMGLIYQTQEEFALAEQHYKDALSADNDFTRGRTYLASLYYKQRKLDSALAEFETAAKDIRYPGRSQVFENIGLIKFQQGRIEESIAAYRRSLTLNRDQPSLYLKLAELFASLQDYQQANKYYENFRESVRAGVLLHTPASLELGIDLARRSGDDDTVSSLKLVLRNLYPNSPENQRELARENS
ncbi:type 4a pilus biogenesis protein PilF [Allohahella marinimesophila]|uniref:Type 4a pilus biogenesis protein PilF n=2 Tax=Allohahella marinimesophila TaxID=1054972 RepID=A0ABP7P4W0_9GAMM